MIKKSLKLLMLPLMLVSIFAVADNPIPHQEITLQTLTIGGIKCDCCRCYLVVSLRNLNGIKSVQEKPATGQVIVQFLKDKITPVEILEFARRLGFKIDTREKSNQEKRIRQDEVLVVIQIVQI